MRTAGSQAANPQNYVINVLDTGAKDRRRRRARSPRLRRHAERRGPADRRHLPAAQHDARSRRRRPTSPAFVALLHGTLARRWPAPRRRRSSAINYDANLNGRLIVEGLGGNDYFAVDDNSAITTLDGGAGDDNFQIGQIYGSADARPAAPTSPSTDVFDRTVATTRGYLSRGTSAPLVAEGGSGNDVFQVYSNQAALRLEGNDGNDLFIVRAFALAQTNADGTSRPTPTAWRWSS